MSEYAFNPLTGKLDRIGDGGGGGGDVTGPGSSVDNNIVIFDGATGKIIKDTGISSLAPSFLGDVSTAGDFNLPATTASAGKLTINAINFLSNGGDASNTFVGGNSGNTTNTSNGSTGIGEFALNALTSGISNTITGHVAANTLTTGNFNSAFGEGSMFFCGGTVNGNTAIGWHTLLSASGSDNIGIGYNALVGVSGSKNIAIGINCCSNVPLSGTDNVVLGNASGIDLTSGSENVYIGTKVSNGNGLGTNNTCVGSGCFTNLTGAQNPSNNTIFGRLAATSIINGANNNTGSGFQNLGQLQSGSFNSVFGNQAGFDYTTSESSNICIANLGVVGDNNTLRIGTNGSGNNQVNKAFIAGISGVTVAASTAVVINSTGQMGTIVSSARFKENIKDLDSESVLNLRAVTFNYIADDTKENNVGLIAEEVYKFLPNLVILDSENKPYSVKYEQLSIYLLSEVKKLSEKVIELEKILTDNKN